MSEVRNLDAGAAMHGLLHPREPAWHRLSDVAGAPDLDRHQMRDVVNDTRSRAYCGPTAVAAIVRQPVSIVRDAFRFARHGSTWPMLDRAPAIIGTTHREVGIALQVFGFHGHWHNVKGNPTLAAFLETREGLLRNHPCIVEVTGHWVAVSGWSFCDTLSKGMVVDAMEAPGRRKRVKSVFLITSKGLSASQIPAKGRAVTKQGNAPVGREAADA